MSLRDLLRPAFHAARSVWLPLRHGRLGSDLAASYRVPGWCRGAEAQELHALVRQLPQGATIVEIGSFLGSGTILVARACADRGGRVHAVDTFDGGGDPHSVPIYAAIIGREPLTIRQQFDRNLRRAGVDQVVIAHAGDAIAIGAAWTTPIDLLWLDGDQSPAGARRAYDAWAPHVKPGGIVAIHNSTPRDYAPEHDGEWRVARESLVPPIYGLAWTFGTFTCARKQA